MDGFGRRLGRRVLEGLAVGAVLYLALRAGGPALLLPLIGAGAGLVYLRGRRRGERDQRYRELLASAEQQDRWAARGDSRGVYGTEGAALMKAVAPDPVLPPGDRLEVAEVVRSTAELEQLLAERRPCWRYAAFVSALVIRRAEVQARLRDARMGSTPPSGESASGRFEVFRFFADRLADLSLLVGRVNDVMLSPAFQEVFGDPHDEDTADPAGIVQAAGRLMDLHDRFLELCERCCAVDVPADCADLHRDVAVLTGLPLQGFDAFIDDFTERVAEMADVARYATGDVELDPVELGVADDGELVTRVSQRLQRLV